MLNQHIDVGLRVSGANVYVDSKRQNPLRRIQRLVYITYSARSAIPYLPTRGGGVAPFRHASRAPLRISPNNLQQFFLLYGAARQHGESDHIEEVVEDTQLTPDLSSNN